MNTPNEPDPKATLDEFQAVRAEILLRIELRSKLLALGITIFGAIVALAANETFPREVLFIFPVIALFIAIEWSYHDLRIYGLGNYIKSEIEPRVPGLGWQHHIDDHRQQRAVRMTGIAAGGVFVCGSLLSLALALADYQVLFAKFGAWLGAFITIDVLSIIAMIIMLRMRRDNTKSFKVAHSPKPSAPIKSTASNPSPLSASSQSEHTDKNVR